MKPPGKEVKVGDTNKVNYNIECVVYYSRDIGLVKTMTIVGG